MRLFAVVARLGGIRATKAALGQLGLPGGWPRLPRLPLTGEEAEAVRRDVIDAFDLDAWL